MGAVIKKPFNIVRRVTVDDETLKRIAELLGIPEAERDRIITGEIVIGERETPSGGGASSPGTGGGASPSGGGGRRTG